ncbi:aldo/keto reductase [Paenibacillus zanthoxyli]|uniref:aldo/keto reductase n=1 Tax=Paenibacillus zanthoxyli TaxID=369399 RepID=UPI001E38551E|nr:aldo/keto reductase [Paenibacillus zanthoxyli]
MVTIKYIPVQGLDKSCSQLVIGTADFSRKRLDAAFEMLDAYILRGGNTIDTANVYGDGESELVIGQWLKSRQLRQNVVIIDKGGHYHVNANQAIVNRLTRQDVAEDLERSLERLQTDYIDIYLLHRDDPSVPVDEIMDFLQEHIDSGLIKAVGASNWSVQRIEEANRYANKKGYNRLVVNSPSLSLAAVNEPRWPGTVYVDQAYHDWHKQTQLPLFAWSSQAGGFFSGRYSPGVRVSEDMVRVYYSDDNWKRLGRASSLAAHKGKGITANHIALAYVLNQPYPVCAVIGPERLDELISSFAALDIRMTDAERLWLNLDQW